MKRIDPGTPLDCEHLIARGHVALVAIASEAHAARVAAQKAELEVALSEARRGDPNMLRSWLESYRGISESPDVVLNQVPMLHATGSTGTSGSTAGSTATASSTSAVSPKGNGLPSHSSHPLHLTSASTFAEPPAIWERSTTEEPTELPLVWDRLMPAARERLEARASELLVSEESSTNTLVSPSPETRSSIENETDNSDKFVVADDGTYDKLREERSEDQFEAGSDEFEADEPLVYEELPELQVLKGADRDLGKPLLRSGKRGLVFSIVAHSVLISTLMAITMRIPDQPASLGFEGSASEGTLDAFEVLQPIEVTSPEEISPERPSEATESSVSLPSAVGLSSTSVNAATSAAASTMSGVQASANRAVAASSGRPSPASANASFFGAAASGNCFCYVIDGSESMRGGPWEAAKAELLRSLASMKPSHRFYIIFFNQKLSAITMPGEREPATSPLYATPENLKHAQNWIESLRIDRGAPPNAALLDAIEIEPDAI